MSPNSQPLTLSFSSAASPSVVPGPVISSPQSAPLETRLSTLDTLRGIRVCFLAGTLGQGGAERQLYYILKTLKESGAEVTLLSLTRGEHWEAVIGGLGVPVKFVGEPASRLK